jgi:two-component system, NtrC family, response regulator AtoC
VAATNRNLKQAIADRSFREDLFYRLNGMSFTLPPLRARRSEIRPLCQVFATRACIEHGRPPGVVLSESALSRLEGHSWPGNVRELKNVIERAVVLCQGTELGPEHLPPDIATPAVQRSAAPWSEPSDAGSAPSEPNLDPAARLRQEMAELERERVLAALEESGGNQSLAAERLGMSRRSLVYRLSAFGLTRSRKRS